MVDFLDECRKREGKRAVEITLELSNFRDFCHPSKTHNNLLEKGSRTSVSMETLSAENRQEEKGKKCFRCLHVFVMDGDDARTLSLLDLGLEVFEILDEQVCLRESF